MRLRNVKNKEEILNNSDYLIKNPTDFKGKWKSLFKNDNPIYIEIGMGKGKFLLENALKNKNINYIGIERFDSVMAKAIKKIPKDIENIRLIRMNALDIDKVFNSIEHGAAGSWSLSNLGPRMAKEDYAPGFYVKHFIKDMKLAIEESEKMGLYMPGLLKAKEVYDALSEAGYDDNGTQAVIQLLKNHIKKR